ncbi:hypothetical protein PG997_008597 [Apiospora hydei]|uniref:Cytochrome P450 n=1 Tax=Apiospora hydei TaxID=1337664 RepID=A0ABR1WF32_9PEZI
MSPTGDLISGTQPVAVVATVFFVIVVGGLYHQFVFFSVKYPSNLPLVGEPLGKRHFSWRTRWRYMTDCEGLYREVYENTVLVPGLGLRNETILPQNAMKWLLALPETSLSPPQAIVELNYLGDDKYGADAWSGHVVRSKTTVVLERICGDMNQELQYTFDTRFGTDENNWKELNLLDTARLMVAQAAGRFTVGLPPCRDEQYLLDTTKVGDGLVMSGGIAGGTPRPRRSLVGLILSSYMKPQIERIKKHVRSTYLERLETLKHNPEDSCQSEPEDFFQMMMRFAQKGRPHEVHDFDAICRHLVVANFGTMHHTAFQVANLILNIINSDAEFNTILVFRNEFSAVLGKVGDDDQGWTKAKVASLTRADSVSRETLRLDSFGNRFQFHKVLVDNLVTEDGAMLPRAAQVLDASPSSTPRCRSPFRFSRTFEAAAEANGKPGLQNFTFVGTGPPHLLWSHGKHACSGRFLVDFELKIVMAYLQNYDIKLPPEYERKRPPIHWMAEAASPPAGAKI